MMNVEVIITNGDLKQSYEVISPVFVQISNRGILKNKIRELEIEYHDFIHSLQEKGLIGGASEESKETLHFSKKDGKSDMTGLKMEKAFYIAIEELKKKALVFGANAVVYMRYETDILTDNADFYLQMYGTAVKVVE